MLTPTIDAVDRCANSRAAFPLEVKIDAAFAFGCASMILSAWSTSGTGQFVATGPNTSSAAEPAFGRDPVEHGRSDEVAVFGSLRLRPSSAIDAPSAIPRST
jgi:hypothetical protein